ncbi:MAG: beta-N-acetylhexosaminidase [Bdellovibrionales bacterium]|nr:beta-N-acetylhexosaminidase [Bdellovibrionales bacterium]
MKEKIGQLFTIGIRGTELTQDEQDFLVKNNIGGVCLFSRNVESPEQVHRLCNQIQNLRTKLPGQHPFLISIDMEGGRVHRLKPPFTQWPALEKLGKLDSTSLAFKFALMMGDELRSVGINLDFAPCMDVLTNPENPVIGDRSISSDAEHVSKISSALVRGYIKSGVIPCGKHFPGHGNTMVDSHEELPREKTSLEHLMDVELQPFKKAFRARLEMIMTGHILFENIDPENPVTLSKKFLKDILRTELRYRHIVVSDDLDMKALANHYKTEDIPVMALDAGCDMVLYCNDFETPGVGFEAVCKAVQDGRLNKAEIEDKLKLIETLKKDHLGKAEIMPFDEATKYIGHPDHLKLSKAILDGKIPEELLTT